jgi:hypothetical protein
MTEVEVVVWANATSCPADDGQKLQYSTVALFFSDGIRVGQNFELSLPQAHKSCFSWY